MYTTFSVGTWKEAYKRRMAGWY